MTDSNQDAFEPLPGRLGTREDGGPSFRQQVMRAVGRAGGYRRPHGPKTAAGTGRFNKRGRGAQIAASLPPEAGWRFDRDAGMRVRPRRVIAKMRIVKKLRPQSRAAYAHFRYLRREGVTLDGERAQVYSALEDRADVAKFLERGVGDRHQFRLMISPEDAAEIASLRDFTRRLVGQMERDLGTTLDWVAIDHHNTGHPHTHIVIRGVTDQGKTLIIASHYITCGIRHRAREITTLELGPQRERELQYSLRHEVGQDRLTRLDRALLNAADAAGVFDLGHANLRGFGRHLLIGRLQKLERLGLAWAKAPGRWVLSGGMERTLRDIGERAEITDIFQRTVAARGLGRRHHVIHRDPQMTEITGRVIGKGRAVGEHPDKVHLLIDATDGRVHYIELSRVVAHTAQVDRIIEVAPARSRGIERGHTVLAGADHVATLADKAREWSRSDGGGVLALTGRVGVFEQTNAGQADAAPGLRVRVLSVIGLEAQVTAPAATWLDRALLAPTAAAISDRGFGRELRDALARRQRWLVEQGLARRQGGQIALDRNLLAALAAREVRAIGEKLAKARGLSLRVPRRGERVSGRYHQTLELVSGPYALLETSRELTLLPWRRAIGKAQGHTVSGLVVDQGVDWEIGRQRRLFRAI